MYSLSKNPKFKIYFAAFPPFLQARFPWLAPLTASVYGAQHALLGSKE